MVDASTIGRERLHKERLGTLSFGDGAFRLDHLLRDDKRLFDGSQFPIPGEVDARSLRKIEIRGLSLLLSGHRMPKSNRERVRRPLTLLRYPELLLRLAIS